MRSSLRSREGGSRFLYEPFDRTHARVETLERVLDERWDALETALAELDRAVERVERRLWLAVIGVAAAALSHFAALWTSGALQTP